MARTVYKIATIPNDVKDLIDELESNDLGSVLANLDVSNMNSTTNNLAYPPNGLGYRFNALTTNRQLRGIEAPQNGDIETLILLNDTTRNITLRHNNANANVGNRFLCPAGFTYTLRDYAMVKVTYINGFWRIQGDR